MAIKGLFIRNFASKISAYSSICRLIFSIR